MLSPEAVVDTMMIYENERIDNDCDDDDKEEESINKK